MNSDKKCQLDKFKEAARELETDDDEERFNEKLKKLAKAGSKQTLTDESESESIEEGKDD